MDYYSNLITKYKNKGILIDSNLLLVYFIGKYDLNRLQSFKKTAKYSIDDYYIINNFIKYFNSIITTPNILTEVSNLSNKLSDDFKKNYYREFRNQVIVLKEIYCPSKAICEYECFERLGLTDTCITMLSKKSYLVLTDDFPLSNRLQSLNIDALNFNHIRSIIWINK